MTEAFSQYAYHALLLQGDASGAAEYLQRFPEQDALAQRYAMRFAADRFDAPTTDATVNAVLHAYADYYRNDCWIHMKHAAARIILHDRLCELLQVDQPITLSELENSLLPDVFAKAGYHFFGGEQDGLHGAYVWRDTELCSVPVELPDGTCEYDVKLLDGVVHKSWLDYISFGMLGMDSWLDSDGTICCIREHFALKGEHVSPSLLRHEAQHASDIRRYPDVRLPELEYRAKLTEMIYSTECGTLTQLLHEADPQNGGGNHAQAAETVVRALCRWFGCEREGLVRIRQKELVAAAGALFAESTRSLLRK